MHSDFRWWRVYTSPDPTQGHASYVYSDRIPTSAAAASPVVPSAGAGSQSPTAQAVSAEAGRQRHARQQAEAEVRGEQSLQREIDAELRSVRAEHGAEAARLVPRVPRPRPGHAAPAPRRAVAAISTAGLGTPAVNSAAAVGGGASLFSEPSGHLMGSPVLQDSSKSLAQRLALNDYISPQPATKSRRQCQYGNRCY